ncbi:MAG: Acetoin utilization protein AcuC [Syntrophorhabdus sp. PtaU1.Bin002]|nr:MAG: Acetoin utilization protein AcuC [Syntrophorhabdus sp. PtaU1.Bin002]
MLNVLLHSNELANSEYRPNHPFKPARARLLLELLNRYALLDHVNQKIVEPTPLDEELLYLFHTKEYIDILKRAENGEFTVDMLQAGLGTTDNPVFPSMFRLALLASGATYEGAMLIFRNVARMAFNPIGGFHHAGRDHAEGFCYINDIAIAIADLVRKGQRVAYIDIDAHHGNGVQDAFFDTNRVLNISLHESGKTLYPGTGFETEIGSGEGTGYTVNIPFQAETDDEVYLFTFDALVPPLVKAFNPDIVFTVIGADAHKDDPLAHLNLTSNAYKHIVTLLSQISPKIMAVGAGGYNVHRAVSLWTLAWAAFCGLEPVDLHAGLIGGMMYGPEANAGSLEDPPYTINGLNKDLCLDHAKRVVQFIQDHVFPIHGIVG